MSSQDLLIGSLLGQGNVFPVASRGPRLGYPEPHKSAISVLEADISGLRPWEQEVKKPAASQTQLQEPLAQKITLFENQNQVVLNEFGVFVPRGIFGGNVAIRHQVGRMADGSVSVLVCGVSREPRGRRARARVDCRAEQQWLERHGAEFVGQWVALDGDRLLGHGGDAATVYEEARRLGVAAPFLVKVEPPDELPFAGW